MIKIASIVKKNLQIIAYSKVSVLLMIFGPILLMLFIGIGLGDNSMKSVRASVFYEGENSGEIHEGGNSGEIFADNFISALRVDSFIVHQTKTLERCIEDVKTSISSICIHINKSEITFPDELASTQRKAEAAGVGSSIKLYVDFSQPRTVWSLIAKVNAIVERFSDGIRSESAVMVTNNFKTYSSKIGAEKANIQNAIKSLRSTHELVNDALSRLDNYDNSLRGTLSMVRSNIEGALVVLPPGNERNLLSNALLEITSLDNRISSNEQSIASTRTSLLTISNFLQGSIDSLEQIQKRLDDIEQEVDEAGGLNWDYVLHPIPLTYSGLSGEYNGSNTSLDFLDYLFPSLLSFFILLSSLFISSNLMIRENTSEANIRNVLGKTSRITFFIGNFLTLLLVIAIQISLLLLIASNFLGFSVFNDLISLSISLSLSISVFIILGMLIANISKNQETAIVSGISLSLILIIFSSLITPIDTLPVFLKSIIMYSPVVITESFFRRLFIFESSLSSTFDLIFMLCISLIMSMVVYTLFSKIFKKERI